MKSTIRLTIIAAMIVVGMMLTCGDPMADTTIGEWITSIVIGLATLAAAGALYISWDAKGLIADDNDNEW